MRKCATKVGSYYCPGWDRVNVCENLDKAAALPALPLITPLLLEQLWDWPLIFSEPSNIFDFERHKIVAQQINSKIKGSDKMNA